MGLVVLSANRTVVSANRAFRQAFGLRIEDLRGKTIEQILPSDRLIEKIREMMVNGIPQPGLLLQHGGKLLRIAILPLRNWDEETEMETLLMVDDVSDVRSDAASSPVLTRLVRSVASDLVRRSRSVARGCRPAPVHGRQWRGRSRCWDIRRRIGSNRRRSSRSGFTRRIARRCSRSTGLRFSTSREVSAEFRTVTASGETIWCRETVRQAEPGVLAGVLTAIGQRTEMEQMRITAERNSALHSLSARLAHDLEQSFDDHLGICGGDAATRWKPNDPRRAELEQILAATERIGSLTAQLLEFTRKQASPAERVDLAALLSGLGGKIETRAAKPVWAMANRQQLEEILPVLVSIMKEDRTPVVVTCDTAAITEQIAGASLAPGDLRARDGGCIRLRNGGREA